MDTPETTALPRDGRRLVPTKSPGVYKRGGAYVVRYRDPQGKQRQRAARTLAEARRLRSELSADVSRGEYRADTKTTFATYAERWLASYAGRTARGLKPETLAEYRRDLARAVEHFGRRRLGEIGPPDIKAFAKKLADTGLSAATVRRLMVPLKALLATAVEDGLLRANPSAGVRLPIPATSAVEGEDAKALTSEQARALVAEVPDGWRRLLVRLMAETGLRVGEALGLRWRDVSDGRLRVRQRVREGIVGTPKSRNGGREVPVSRETSRALAAHRLASTYSTDDDFVFASAAGTAHHASNLYGWYKPAAERAGMGWAGFHTLRHTAASRWLMAGVGIAQVSRLLGHADAGFTLRTYIHALPSDLPAGDELAAAVGVSAG